MKTLRLLLVSKEVVDLAELRLFLPSDEAFTHYVVMHRETDNGRDEAILRLQELALTLQDMLYPSFARLS